MSPADISSRGSFLHVSVFLLVKFCRHNENKVTKKRTKRSAINHLIRFINTDTFVTLPEPDSVMTTTHEPESGDVWFHSDGLRPGWSLATRRRRDFLCLFWTQRGLSSPGLFRWITWRSWRGRAHRDASRYRRHRGQNIVTAAYRERVCGSRR